MFENTLSKSKPDGLDKKNSGLKSYSNVFIFSKIQILSFKSLKRFKLRNSFRSFRRNKQFQKFESIF